MERTPLQQPCRCSKTRDWNGDRFRIPACVGLTALAFLAATTMQGCVPPDWSFCDCDFRDNYWNSVLSDVHRLWDGEFAIKARDNRTFQGRYMENPPPGIDCPEQAVVFWKAWPQYGMTRGLIEGSMGDLWMPGARDRIKSMCMSGHLALCAICSQHFLVKAARAIEAGDPNHMRWLEAAYSHMASIRNLAYAHQIRSCMGQQGWSLKAGSFHAYTVRWLGPEANTAPVAAYNGGVIDPWQMLYNEDMQHTEKSRRESLPDRRTCAPYKDPTCWKRQSKLLMETCEWCCSPFEHKTGTGNPMCWDDVYTFERCCQQDFKDLVCEMIRKGEEGGCVDCPKSVVYSCLTPEEKRLKDAQNNYNKKVDLFHELQDTAKRLATEIQETKEDLFTKEGIYQTKGQTLNQLVHIWSEAHNNRTRLEAAARLEQQDLTWNNSFKVRQQTKDELIVAQESLKNATDTLREARREEEFGRQTLASNESAYHHAVARHHDAVTALADAEAAQSHAESNVRLAEDEVTAAATAAEEALAQAVAANVSRDERYQSTAEPLHTAETARNATRAIFEAAELVASEKTNASQQAQALQKAAQETLNEAVANVAAAERNVTGASDRVSATSNARQTAEEQLQEGLRLLATAMEKENESHQMLTNRTGSTSAVLCLISKTAANASALPKVPPPRQADAGSCGVVIPKDLNEFCGTWAEAGECEKNRRYMTEACGASCAARGVHAAVAKATECNSKDKPSGPDADGSLSRLIAELLQGAPLARDAANLAEARLLAELPAIGNESEAETIVVPEELKVAIATADNSLASAKLRQQSASTLVAAAMNVLRSAEQDLEQAKLREETARGHKATAQNQAVEGQKDVSKWQALVALNQSALADANKVLDRRRDDHKKLQAALDKSLSLEQGLARAHQLAEDASVQARQVAARSKRAISELEEHVQRLNESMSENLTTLVSAWVKQQEAHQQASLSPTWSSRLLAAAKSVLVKMVGSIESFLETYVVSLADKDSVVELVKAIDDKHAAILQLQLDEKSAEDAAAEAKDAKSMFIKAEASRKVADEAVAGAATKIPEAEELSHKAEAALNATKLALNASEESLAEARRLIEAKEAEIQSAVAATKQAASVVEQKKADLRNAEVGIEIAKAEVTQALTGLKAAQTSFADAHAQLIGGSLAQIKQHCRPTEEEFEAYLDYRDLIALAKHVTAQRQRSSDALKQQLERHEERLREAKAAQLTAEKALAESQRHQGRCEDALKLAEADLDAKEVERLQALDTMNITRMAFDADQAKVEVLLESRSEADAASAQATESSENAAQHSASTLSKRNLRSSELDLAINVTQTKTEALAVAREAEADGLRSLELTKVWHAAFNESLELELKQQRLSEAIAEEKHRNNIHVSRALRESRMKLLLRTHERRLALCDAEVGLAEKLDARVHAKAEFDRAEAALLAAQTKLDELLKSESETHTKIAETYKEIEELLTQHGEAQKAYDAQDPKERERSFSTSLTR